MTTMRAVTQDVYGPPSALHVEQVPIPAPADDEVLVRVETAGIDAGTWHLTTGRPYLMRAIGLGFRGPKARIRGMAFAGVVEGTGERVLGSADGALAEYVAVKASDLVARPDDLGAVEAAALPISGVTALQAVRAAGIREGDRVLVLGAAGGVGHFAVQLATAQGGRVTGVCSGAKADLVRELGAEEVVDYTTTDVLALGRIWDVIIDTAGNRPLGALRRILSPTGSLVIVGGEAAGPLTGGIGRTAAAGLLNAVSTQHLVGLVSTENADDERELVSLWAQGAVRPVIDTVYPLEHTADAVEHIGAGRARGKVVVTL
ncbi:NAD(P)-dependent alcohol dehydrogenase [Leifsonia sp. F6_8S_P_1B]|uniref:NAD(P)-dependent alcohol dehydrogenase n=1 Tax=Leifsonia williamsii TaxID=3035919 RepID=A0ABT8KH21_9MICO|nr:NAD(P)-dependent alcohol dehydrogenase [Leifsonia williamsii]MDN4616288.1 NAD(P)-dependent alcohol dehydrogenase [Leifsonia williamsii]